MSDFTMPDGRELTFDLSRITMREYRGMMDNAKPDENDELIVKCAGNVITAEEIADLPQPVARRLLTSFFKKAREPLADPK